MSKARFFVTALTLVVLTLGISSLANAQATRTWVSGVGDDANPCSRTAPCKTFAGAISKTATDGEIDCIDPGGFGAVTITKSITIDGNGTFASILAAGTNGVIINITSGTDARKAVRLRNLSINGAATGLNGIRLLAAKALYMESCQVYGFFGTGGNGLSIELGAGTANVSVKDSIFENNGNDGIKQTTTGTLNAYYDNVVLAGNVRGLENLGGTANISRSVVDNNSADGLAASGGAVIDASTNQITSNGNGTNCTAPSTIRLSDNNIYRNLVNGIAGGGTYLTFGNNHVSNNAGNEALPAATLPK